MENVSSFKPWSFWVSTLKFRGCNQYTFYIISKYTAQVELSVNKKRFVAPISSARVTIDSV